ncbi:hypothetical protein EDC04DRAFT_2613068 [Pisolithus marmoratus]|nr:hypothetical protein EDC04DRAFT_2613068 [Pisolithus marmoratus]
MAKEEGSPVWHATVPIRLSQYRVDSVRSNIIKQEVDAPLVGFFLLWCTCQLHFTHCILSLKWVVITTTECIISPNIQRTDRKISVHMSSLFDLHGHLHLTDLRYNLQVKYYPPWVQYLLHRMRDGGDNSHYPEGFRNYPELLSSVEHEDCVTDMMSPLPNHASDGYQGEDHKALSVKFIGPGSKVYCNYHPGLNACKCDDHGQFLPDDAALPSCVEKVPNDWTSYHNQLEFKPADFLFTHAEMSAKKINMLLEIWATLLLELGGQLLFMNHMDLYGVIDSTCVGNVRFTGKLDYVPYLEYDASNEQRHWQDFMLGDWAWEQAICQDRILGDDPTTAGSTLVPVILGSDKTTVSVATGQTDYYLLYLSIGNQQENMLVPWHSTDLRGSFSICH